MMHKRIPSLYRIFKTNQTSFCTNDQNLFQEARDQWIAPHGTNMDDLLVKSFPNLMTFANWPTQKGRNKKKRPDKTAAEFLADLVQKGPKRGRTS
jgi:hypothetical protein